VLYHLSLTGAVTFRTTSHPDSEALTIPQSPPKIVPVPQIFRTPLLRAHMCTFTVCTNHKCWPLKKCVREHLSRRTEVGKEKVTYPIGRVLPPSLAISFNEAMVVPRGRPLDRARTHKSDRGMIRKSVRGEMVVPCRRAVHAHEDKLYLFIQVHWHTPYSCNGPGYVTADES